ncbi:MAG: hypothetical protein IT236_08220 [Bacteroidia bacterium]|nr:hypothetical protein [Bacteroidia bacterium]
MYSFSVRAKEWKLLPSSIRIADVTINAINSEIKQTGQVMVFLGAAEKYVKLPFKYYQLRKILSIRASFSPQRVIIKISGKFILNVNSSFNFMVVVLSANVPHAYRQFNWTNFENIRTRFKIKIKDKT